MKSGLNLIEQDQALFPFNECEHLICTLIDKGDISYSQYVEIRRWYIIENPNLWIFKILSPWGFDERFFQAYVQGKCFKLKKTTKKFDYQYSSEYALWIDGITIEEKFSWEVDSDSDDPLYMKALSRHTKKRYLMNFQQLKPQCCDVFIWVAVFRDEIVLWIINSDEVLKHPLYSKGQHRGNKGSEGQFHVKDDNVQQLERFELKDDNIEKAIRDAAARKNS